MKLKKRIVVLAATLAFAMVLPQAALAAEIKTEADAKQGATVTTEPFTKPAETEKPGDGTQKPDGGEATPTPTPEPTPVPDEIPQDVWGGEWGVLTAHSISSGTGGTTLDTSNLTVDFFFNFDDSNKQAVPDMKTWSDLSIRLKDNGAFSAQDLKVETIGKHILRVSGLKYTNTNNTRLEATISSSKEGFPELTIGENIRELYPVAPEDDGTGTGEGEGASNAPGLIVKSSSIGSDVVNAGEEFTLSLTVYATSSGKKNVNDVVVSVAPAEGLVISSGSSTYYVGTMKPGQSKTVSFPMRALPDFTGGVSTVAVTVSGSESTGTPTTVSVPVRQPDRFEVSRVEVPDIMMVGEENVATVYFVNKGKNPVNNITVQLAGTNMQQSTQSQYVGNVAAGTEDSADLDLSPVEGGNIEGTITITYEAPSGETVTLTEEISVPVENMSDPMGGMEDPGMMDPEFPVDGEPTGNGGLAPWQIALIVVVAAGAVAAVVVVLRKRAAKKKAAQEESDEDF